MPKAVQKKKKRVAPARAPKPGPAKAEAAPVRTDPSPSGAAESNLGTRLRVIIVVLAVGVFFFTRWRASRPATADAAGAAPPAAVAATGFQVPADWGASVKLKEISSFTAPQDTRDFYVSSKGEVVFLTGSSLYDYTAAGDLSYTANLGTGPNRSMACDGKSIYLTDSDNGVIYRFNMDFSAAGSIQVLGGSHLMGIGWSPTDRVLIACEAGGTCYYSVSPDGKTQKKHLLDRSKASTASFIYDVAEDHGGFAITDTSNEYIILTSLGGGTQFQPGPGTDTVGRRIAIINGFYYVPCDQGPVAIYDDKWAHKGYLDAQNAAYARAGRDGFLYILAQGDILKYKPL